MKTNSTVGWGDDCMDAEGRAMQGAIAEARTPTGFGKYAGWNKNRWGS